MPALLTERRTGGGAPGAYFGSSGCAGARKHASRNRCGWGMGGGRIRSQEDCDLPGWAVRQFCGPRWEAPGYCETVHQNVSGCGNVGLDGGAGRFQNGRRRTPDGCAGKNQQGRRPRIRTAAIQGRSLINRVQLFRQLSLKSRLPCKLAQHWELTTATGKSATEMRIDECTTCDSMDATLPGGFCHRHRNRPQPGCHLEAPIASLPLSEEHTSELQSPM